MNGHKVEIHAEARIDFHNHVEYLATRDSTLEIMAAYAEEIIAADEAIGARPLTWPLARPSR